MNTGTATGLESRAAALDVLGAVLSRGNMLDDALAAASMDAMAPRDRAFARLLVATAIRRLGQIDALIDHCLARPLPGRAGQVRDILRLGICQLVLLGTPPHAAVDSAVRLAVAGGHDHHKKLVNAVLRRIAREGAALITAQDAPRLNTPDWLWRSWSGAYGEAVCRAIAEAHLALPPLDITVKADAAQLAAEWGARLEAEILPTGSLRIARPSGAPTALAGFDQGAWWVQDAAAALPAKLLVAALGEGAGGRTIIDLCAAPGGKTAQLAAAGALVTAVDQSERRLDLVRGNLGRLGLEARLVAADAARWRPETPAHGVLLDAPCTATGTIRRHPDVLHAKTPGHVERQTLVQAGLVRAAAAMVAPGGVLLYSVCSLQPEEGIEIIEAFLAEADGFARVPVAAAEVGGLGELITSSGDVRTLPCHLAERGGMDGFYIARLRRIR